MTTVYFIRHATPDFSIHDDAIRPLSEKGIADCSLITRYLESKKIDALFSSPYKRAYDTILPFSEASGIGIAAVDDFRERRVDSGWIENFNDFSKKQWEDFSYKLSDGECLDEVQKRGVWALRALLETNKDKNIAIATHGTLLSTIINYYDKSYGYEDFCAMQNIMPWITVMYFEGTDLAGICKIDPFTMPSDDSVIDLLTFPPGALKGYRFVVIFAMYNGKLLYCRHKERDCFETAGGHIEHGEAPLDAAKRELWEETGALEYTIEPMFDYYVRKPLEFSNGQAFFANINKLGEPPAEFEMAETMSFDTIPDKMRFPEILPSLYKKTMEWLSLQGKNSISGQNLNN